MNSTRNRVVVVVSMSLGLMFAPAPAPGKANADECGPEMVYDSELGACVPEVLGAPLGPPPWEYPVPGFPGGACWIPNIPQCF